MRLLACLLASTGATTPFLSAAMLRAEPSDCAAIADADKTDCGHAQMTEGECVEKSCCWAPREEGSTTPWCFHAPSEATTPAPPLTEAPPTEAPDAPEDAPEGTPTDDTQTPEESDDGHKCRGKGKRGENRNLQVLGKSGKIRYINTANPEQSATIEFGSLREKNVNGAAVGVKRGQKIRHSVERLSSEGFSVSPVQNVNFPNSGPAECTDDCNAQMFAVQTTLQGRHKRGGLGADAGLKVYIANKNATITNGDEVTTLNAGAMKFDLDIKNWPFCDPAAEPGTPTDCKGDAGQFLDVEMIVQTPKSPRGWSRPRSPRRPVEIDGGDGTRLVLSEKYQIADGTWKSFPEGYPKVEPHGQKTVYTFRFEKDPSFHYDPAVDFVEEGEATTPTPATAAPTEAPGSDEEHDGRGGDKPNDDVGREMKHGDKRHGSEGREKMVRVKDGKISYYASDDTNKMTTIEVDDLQEIGADGKEVGKKAKPSHHVSSISQKGLTVLQLQDAKFGSSEACEGDACNAKMFAIETALQGKKKVGGLGAAVGMKVYIATKNATIVNDDEVAYVTEGTMKFDLNVDNWPFCDPAAKGTKSLNDCGGEAGEFLDFAIKIKTPGSPRMHGEREREKEGEKKAAKSEGKWKNGKRKAAVIDGGDGTSIILSEKYQADGVWNTFVEGYPMVEVKGSNTVYTFRMKKATKLHYDPAVTYDAVPETIPAGADVPPSGGDEGGMGLFTIIAIVAVIAGVGFFAFKKTQGGPQTGNRQPLTTDVEMRGRY